MNQTTSEANSTASKGKKPSAELFCREVDKAHRENALRFLLGILQTSNIQHAAVRNRYYRLKEKMDKESDEAVAGKVEAEVTQGEDIEYEDGSEDGEIVTKR
ncbi:hypothetical protein N7508_010398 [Penicillium antarcticum]|uniref:uncharacterized protein n=1 Tax=Penicillium antarcticum TaxID=416450 RepID=UPI00238E7EE2|nr:uncharacterized protein N7508_010398 [Penicillium antarcticum]KAJ5295577.1 hypothetical protein N7508_010398 [Penicillium antarcticum]